MWAIGIDVGGTKTSIGLIDTRTGRIAERVELVTPPPAKTGKPFLDRVAGAARRIAETSDGAAGAPVGIGICELLDSAGEIVSAHRVKWASREVRSAFGFAGRVAIEADARAAAIAEAAHGAGAGLRHWIYANAGTGIATILMDAASPYPGAHGRALCSGMGPATFLPGHSTGESVEDISGGAGMLQRA